MTSDETMRHDDVIGVVGLGALGRGIVACCLSRGFAAVGIDREQSNRKRLSVYLPEAAAQCVEAGVVDANVINANDPEDWQARLELSGDLASIDRACLVIEAIPEDLPSKKQLLQEIERIVPADVPIGSNTSAFPITTLQEGCKHPERIFGMHWSSHGHVTRFMELTPGEQTSPQTMAFAVAMAGGSARSRLFLRRMFRDSCVTALPTRCIARLCTCSNRVWRMPRPLIVRSETRLACGRQCAARCA